ncbi:helix-turn-helix domain-containing protein [Halohasta litorea]|uniref:Helix-turn-helix domain-containing protein n=1 Tax=Halohasta litorea TaxID=869891 RepID=A0ABD6DBV4_9EURY|nr:helix-turn-helix domain-containing protein [Halohasta litorea]
MYTEAELQVLATLKGDSSISELADDLNRSVNYTSELVQRVETKGLVNTHRSGKTKRIQRSDAKAVELFDTFVQQYSHIPFPELLDGATLRVLYYLDSPRSATDLADLVGVHRSTVHRALSPLQDRGIIYKSDGQYVINDEFKGLVGLAQEFAHLRNRTRIAEYVDSHTILWESPDEFLVQTDDVIESDAFVTTGPERFQAFGLPLLARQRRYYLYSPSKDDISAAELCCHMLVIDDGTRTRSYCLLLLKSEEVDRGKVLSLAETYDVSTIVSDLLSYLDTEGEERADRLPTWSEFRELADEYGVAI